MDDFKILSTLKECRFGSVRLVRNVHNGRKYVVKSVHIEQVCEREQVAVKQETKLLETLKHPNIVGYARSFQADNWLFIVTTYCEGGDLASLIRQNRDAGICFPEGQIAEWMIQICMALQYLHDHKVLHRDLKTENIFLTKYSVIKVGDLGIAKVLKAEEELATTQVGTPYYMSPEVFLGHPYSYKSDVWSLGCCVFELAALRPAFRARDLPRLRAKVIGGHVSHFPSGYSEQLKALVDKMLKYEPEKRPSPDHILHMTYVQTKIVNFLKKTKNPQKSKPVLRTLESKSPASEEEKEVDAVTVKTPQSSSGGPKSLPNWLYENDQAKHKYNATVIPAKTYKDDLSKSAIQYLADITAHASPVSCPRLRRRQRKKSLGEDLPVKAKEMHNEMTEKNEREAEACIDADIGSGFKRSYSARERRRMGKKSTDRDGPSSLPLSTEDSEQPLNREPYTRPLQPSKLNLDEEIRVWRNGFHEDSWGPMSLFLIGNS